MSYFYDQLKDTDPYLKINNVAMPEVQKPEQVKINLVTDGGRLADSIDYEGSVKGIKREVTLQWDIMNKRHFDVLYNTIMNKYRGGSNMFMPIKFNSFSPDGIVTMTVYAGANLVQYTVKDTTDRLAPQLGESYAYGGADFDILYENVSVHFVEK